MRVIPIVVDDGLYTHRWVEPLLRDPGLDVPAVTLLGPFEARNFNPGGARGIARVTRARLRLYGLRDTFRFALLYFASARSVASVARQMGLEVLRPRGADVHDPVTLKRLKRLGPDVLVCAFSQPAGPALLELPHLGCLGVHFSMMPRHRGREPLFRAMLEGGGAGVSVFRISADLDSGAVLAQQEVPGRHRTLHRLALAASDVAASVVRRAIRLADTTPTSEGGEPPPLRSWPSRDEVRQFRRQGFRFV